MAGVHVSTEQGGAVMRLVIDRPDKRNALSNEMFGLLIDAFESPPPHFQKVAVLAASGAVFSAGVDLSEPKEARTIVRPLERLCEAISEYPLPVVAVVQGSALGGGLMIAMHCDFVIAASDAPMGNPAVQIGLAPPWGLTRRLAELAGTALAREVVLLGDPVLAAQLAEARVIAAAVPAEDLESEVDRVVDRLARNAPLSLRAIKATLNKIPVAESHEDVDLLIAAARDSEDGREGVRARLEKRSPQFTGQ